MRRDEATDYAEATEARETLQRYFEHLFANSRDIMNLFSLTEGKIIMLNRAAQEAMGYTSDELSAMPVDALYPSEERVKLALAFERLTSTGYSSEKLRMYARNGELCDIWTRSYVIQHKPEVICLVHTIDITEENRKRDRELREARLASLGESSATLAHELKNALQSMQFSLGTLRGQLARNEPERAETSLARIERAVAHMDDVISGVEKAARGANVGKGDTSLLTAVQNALQLMRGYLDAKAIGVETEFDRSLPVVHCDRTQLEQILIVLIKNAAQAMASRPERQLRISVCRVDQRIRLEVSDTGGGISKEIEARIFESFATTKPAGLGVGLGLATAKRLAHDNGIDLSFVSQLGDGTTFALEFPLTPSLGGDGQLTPLAGRVVLMIGDDPELFKVGSAALSTAGARVLLATTVGEALQLLRVHSVAGLVCDDAMYPVRGRVFVDQARQVYRGPVCLIVRDQPAHEVHLAGVDFVLRKPLDGTALVTAMATLLA